jgi:hypothetical protein
MRSDDVRAILSRISTLDDKEWGRSWALTAQAWIEKGVALEASGDRAGASDAYILGYRYGTFGG